MRDVLGIALPGNYDTVLLLDWQGLEQYPVHDAEKGRTHPDTEGKHNHSNKKESWMSNDYSGGLQTFSRVFPLSLTPVRTFSQFSLSRLSDLFLPRIFLALLGPNSCARRLTASLREPL